ncbi:MAG: sulfotransferase family protein [Acidimicrobiales bacterium]
MGLRRSDVWDAQAALRPEVVLCGPPRTGSTWLHEILACDPGLRVLRNWEARHPSATDARAARREAADWLAGLDRIAAGFRAMHPMEPDGPEECQAAIAATFRSWQWPVLFDVPGYAEWLRTADTAPVVDTYLRQLSILEPAGRWVLKSPFWAPAVPRLLEHSPKTVVVRTVRHPVDMVTSWLRLLDALHAVTLRRRDRAWFARRWVEILAQLGAAALRIPDAVTVPFPELTGRPVDTLALIYARLGRPVSPDAIAATHRVPPRPRQARPDLEDFGLDALKVLQVFDQAGAGALAALDQAGRIHVGQTS